MKPIQPSMSAITVNLHGLILTFQSPDQPLWERFAAVYGHLPQLKGIVSDVLVRWELSDQPMAPMPPSNCPVIAPGELVSYYGPPQAKAEAERITVRMPKYGLITVDLGRNQLEGTVTRNCLEVYGAFEDVLMISLSPLYRRRGWFPLHAFAALAPDGRIALITGQMGSGKTTTGLALLDAGWKLLSNDSPLLTIRKYKVCVLAYPGHLSAFDDSLARFERLKKFIPNQPDLSREPPAKRVFRAEDAFPKPWAVSGVAGGIFFPQVMPRLAQSRLEPVRPKEAVLKLMPQAIEGWDKALIAPTLKILNALVDQVPCYGLELSPHVDQLPGLIAGGMAT
jgi:hypothetical protein